MSPRPAMATELVDAIERLIDSPGLRNEMAGAGRAHVCQHFSLSTAIAKTIALYGLLYPSVAGAADKAASLVRWKSLHRQLLDSDG